MNDFGKRLFELRSSKKISREALGEKIGVSKTAIKNWEDGENSPKLEFVEALSSYFKVSFEWLSKGKGKPDDQLISVSSISNVDFIPQKIRKAPVLNWVQAGHPADVFDNVYDEYEYFYDEGYGLQVYWLYVRGDSMNPEFFENDKILVDAERQARAGDYVIAMVDHEAQATFKRYKPCGYDPNLGREYCQLVPLNDFYPTIDSRAVRIDIVGVVVKHERKLI